MNKPGSLREKWKAISLEAKLAMFVAPVVVFVVTAFIAKVINGPIQHRRAWRSCGCCP